jgi:hypothetical protein
MDQGTSAVIVAAITAGGAYLIAKASDKAAKRKPPPVPRATKADVEQVEARSNRRHDALEAVVEDLLERLSEKTSETNALRDLFLWFVSAVNRSWNTTDAPPQFTEEQRAMLYNDHPPDSTRFPTSATRRALREHNLVTLVDNPPPSDDPPARRPRH